MYIKNDKIVSEDWHEFLSIDRRFSLGAMFVKALFLLLKKKKKNNKNKKATYVIYQRSRDTTLELISSSFYTHSFSNNNENI